MCGSCLDHEPDTFFHIKIFFPLSGDKTDLRWGSLDPDCMEVLPMDSHLIMMIMIKP